MKKQLCKYNLLISINPKHPILVTVVQLSQPSRCCGLVAERDLNERFKPQLLAIWQWKCMPVEYVGVSRF